MPDRSETARTSSLGRYAPHGDGSDDVTVRLVGLPLRVLAASRQHHDDLMREFRLVALSGRLGGAPAPADLLDLIHVLGEVFAASAPRSDEVFDAALRRGELTLDVEETVPRSAGAVAQELAGLMERADAYCASEQLMTMPRTPVMKRFGDWYCEQYARQAAGEPAVPWDGPLEV